MPPPRLTSGHSELTLPSQPFRFLHLPLEIRAMIYILLITSPKPYVCLIPTDLSTKWLQSMPESRSRYNYPHQLLRVCSQIYYEVRHLYLAINTFTLTINHNNDLFPHYLAPDFTVKWRLIHSLRINIMSRDFFNRIFAPTMADWIVNGNLRRVEVLLNKDLLWEGNDWVVLKTLLNHPHLEEVTVRVGPRLGCGRDDEEVEKDKYDEFFWHLESPGSLDPLLRELDGTRWPYVGLPDLIATGEEGNW